MQVPVSFIDYTASQGDTFDGIAFRFYAEERLAHYIMQANPDMIPILIFDGGEKLKIPRLTEQTLPETLPPWRRGE